MQSISICYDKILVCYDKTQRLKVKHFSPKVNNDFLDGEYEFGLDTGCNCNFLSKDSDLGKNLQTKLGVTPENVIFDERTQQKYLSYHIDHLYLQTYDLGKSHFVLCKMPGHMNNGLIGFDFFHNNLVYIDFEQKELWLKRTDTQNSQNHFKGKFSEASSNSKISTS
jgi:hypothetical protein